MSDEILELIDNKDDYSRGDLQGAAEMIIMNTYYEANKIKSSASKR